MHPQLRAARDRFLQQFSANATAPKLFADINAELDRVAISASREKFPEAEPAGNLAVQVCDPNWILRWRMRAKPFAPALDRDGIQLRGGNALGDSLVMNFDDGRKIGFGGVPDSYFCGGRL